MASEQRPTKVVPSFADEDDGETTALRTYAESASRRKPYLVRLAGPQIGLAHALDAEELFIGRSGSSDLRVDEHGVSRRHARIAKAEGGVYVIEDLGSANGTVVNGRRIQAPTNLADGDKIQVGAETVLKFALFDELEERYQQLLHSAIRRSQVPEAPLSSRRELPWSPESWRTRPIAQSVAYDDPAHLERVVTKLRRLPPLVTSWEVEELKKLIAEAQQGKRFLLQGGDCAETLHDCESGIIANKLKILIQMSLVLIRGSRRPVIRVGRFAGQYAKPRSSPTEVRGGVELPSYFGDLVNQPQFNPIARRPDPDLLLAGYLHAATTLNFIRALSAGGFSDLRRPDYFDLSFFERAEPPTVLRTDYSRMCQDITDGLHFLQAFGDRSADELMKVTFYTSHEALNLLYEAAQTRQVPRREGFYDLTTHLPWIGERTRSLTGAHVEFFRGVANPVAVKVGPNADPAEVVELCHILNPKNEPGKLVLIARMGVKFMDRLSPILQEVRKSGALVLWVCDPMHGNIVQTKHGVKTRNFEDILREVEQTIEIHRELGSFLGGVHFELTGEDVTECIGGGISEADLSRNYVTTCDPRLNYRQAIQMAFSLSRKLAEVRLPTSPAPP